MKESQPQTMLHKISRRTKKGNVKLEHFKIVIETVLGKKLVVVDPATYLQNLAKQKIEDEIIKAAAKESRTLFQKALENVKKVGKAVEGLNWASEGFSSAGGIIEEYSVTIYYSCCECSEKKIYSKPRSETEIRDIWEPLIKGMNTIANDLPITAMQVMRQAKEDCEQK